MLNTPIPSLIEIAQAPEVYCSELSWVERTGPNVRFLLTIDGSTILLGEDAKQVILKVVMPIDAVVPAIELTVRRLALQGVLRFLRIVK
jgi:hypothetical protein